MKVDDLVQAFTQDFIVNDERPYEEPQPNIDLSDLEIIGTQ